MEIICFFTLMISRNEKEEEMIMINNNESDAVRFRYFCVIGYEHLNINNSYHTSMQKVHSFYHKFRYSARISRSLKLYVWHKKSNLHKHFLLLSTKCVGYPGNFLIKFLEFLTVSWRKWLAVLILFKKVHIYMWVCSPVAPILITVFRYEYER